MERKYHRVWKTARAGVVLLLLFIAVMTVFLTRSKEKSLLLTDGDTGEKIASFSLGEDGRFAVSFIHSVNKSTVEEWYEARQDGIYVVACRYYAFGAGVATEVVPPQKLEFLDDGSMLITGFDTKVDELSYIVGTVSDHILIIGEEKISLREVCGKNRTVHFSLTNGS